MSRVKDSLNDNFLDRRDIIRLLEEHVEKVRRHKVITNEWTENEPGSRSVQTIFLDRTHAVWARETWRKYLKLFKWPIIQSVFWRRNTTSMKLLARVLMLMQLSLRQSTLVWLFKLDETVTALHLLRRFTILSTNTIWRRLRPGIGTKLEPSWTKLSKPWWKYCYPNSPNKSFKIFLKT